MPNVDLTAWAALPGCVHVVLIRDPVKLISSWGGRVPLLITSWGRYRLVR